MAKQLQPKPTRPLLDERSVRVEALKLAVEKRTPAGSSAHHIVSEAVDLEHYILHGREAPQGEPPPAVQAGQEGETEPGQPAA